ncbi:MAG: kelch repeat-containing protein [Ekhidna sp.]
MLSNQSFLLRILSLLFAFSYLSSCNENEVSDNSILTEEVIYVSGSTVRIVGRVLELSGATVNDYGFLIDTNEDFTNPIEISVENQVSLGRFIGETNLLEKEKLYFCRTYLDIGDQRIFGNVLNFNSLPPFLFDFNPKLAKPGDVVTVEGANLTGDTKIFFGDIEADVLDVVLESRVQVIVPESSVEFDVDITLVTEDIELISSEKFSYVTGKWEVFQEFFQTQTYSETLSFLKDEYFYYGLGVKSDDGFGINSRLWRMNLSSGTWEDTNFGALSRFPFVADAYFGGGGVNFFGGRSFSNEFRFFDGNNFVNLEEAPFKLYRATAFALEDRVIVVGGQDEDSKQNRQVYSYSISNNSWTENGFLPFVVDGPSPHFVYDRTLYLFNPKDNYLWEYNSQTDKWSQSIEIPTTSATGGFATVLNDKVYIGMFDLTNDVWELDMSTLQLEEKIGYPNSKGDSFTESFAYNNRIYYTVNPFTTIPQGPKPMQIWSFDPNEK